ncbi:MAG: FHA domain-containing protein [Planctomycetes bacterium]|nr:FHA domain-containing protein [Planctomycetota bacterium]
MENRYSLRFESGERRGESISIPSGGITVGRKPGNTLQILDNSVSGSHAVLSIEGDGVLLRDTGSTNGTRVGGQRVLEQRLAHGDTVLFGNMRFTFHDAQHAGGDKGDGIEIEGFDEPLPAESALTATTVTPGVEGWARVSPEHLAQSKSRSLAGIAGVGVLALVGAGLWFWLQRGGGGEGAGGTAVVPVPENLLAAGFSFEDDEGAWSNAEGTPTGFVRSGPAHRSGAFGIEADLDDGQWALYRSRSVRVSSGRALAARAYLRTKGAAEGRIGIEFTNPEISGAITAGPTIVWSAPLLDAQNFQAVELTSPVPSGWSQANVVILARCAAGESGEVDADDACLVPAISESKPAASVAGAELFVLGETAMTAQLVRSERVLFSGLCFTTAGDERGLSAGALTARNDGERLAIEPRGAAAVLVLRAEEPLARARVATIGKDGYRTHALEFERTAVETLLLGSGGDMVRIQLAQPATVRSTPEGGSARIVVTPASKLEIQLDFAAERKEAGNVAYAARGAEQRGELGNAIAQWQTLLNGFPYEDALVNEAETAHARLVQKGLEELRDVEAAVERARFFRLADLYKECRKSALTLAERYRQSEVETQARKVADAVTTDIRELEIDVHKAERARMRGILAALEAQGSTALASEVRRYLNEQLGEQN